VPGRNSKRKHVKSHGLASFTDLARAVASHWKSVDKETKDYCMTVARILKERHTELSEAEAIERLSMIDSINKGPKEETKQRSAKSNRTNNSELAELVCLPTMDYIDSEQANEKERRDLLSSTPRRANNAVGDQQTNHYLGMCVPKSIDSVVHEQGTTDNHDNSRTCATRMYQQYQTCAMRMYQQNQSVQMFKDSGMMRGNANLDFSIDGMPRPNQPGRIQQGIQGTQMPMMNESYGGNELEFPIITNVSQRAMISNMMSAMHTSKQPILHHEGIPSIGEHRGWSAPEFLGSPRPEESHAMYEAQELDITDSDVFGMWLSSKIQEEY